EGRFQAGMDAFYNDQLQKPPPIYAPKSIPQLKSADNLKGKRILVINTGGGGGDEIINVRFARALKERGAQVIWTSNHGLESIFARVAGVDRAFPKSEIDHIECDVWTPEGTLLPLLKLKEHDMRCAPYLTPDAAYIRKWRAKIPDD